MLKKCKDCSSEVEKYKSLCRSCLDKASLRMKRLRENALSNGLCFRCREDKFIEGQTKCKNCIIKDQDRFLSRKKRYLDEYKCIRCARYKGNMLIWNNVDCAGCHLKYKFSFTGTKEQAEQIINELLKKQNFKCAMTGRDLYINKFHIDHIIPKTTAPSRIADPTNWQLIVEEANVFKNGMTVEQTLNLAQDIVKESIRKGIITLESLRLDNEENNKEKAK